MRLFGRGLLGELRGRARRGVEGLLLQGVGLHLHVAHLGHLLRVGRVHVIVHLLQLKLREHLVLYLNAFITAPGGHTLLQKVKAAAIPTQTRPVAVAAMLLPLPPRIVDDSNLNRHVPGRITRH